MNPIEPIDYIAWLALILMLAVVVMAVRDAFNQAQQLHAAYELVDETFADIWTGDRNLELYSWTVTKVRLFGHENPFINEVISQRLREFHAKKRNGGADSHPPKNQEHVAIWSQSPIQQITLNKPTI